MQIFLAKHVKAVTGTLSKQHGFFIRQFKNGFFSARSPHVRKYNPYGHISFIRDCILLTHKNKLFADIALPLSELNEALDEAGLPPVTNLPQDWTLNAKQTQQILQQYETK